MGSSKRAHGRAIAGWALAAGVVGAGFASGREAAVFFAPFGLWGMVGVALTTWLMGRAVCRPAGFLPPFFEAVWQLLTWVTLAATLAAGGEILHHLVDWPVPAGAGLLGCLAVIAPRREGIRRWQGATVLLLAAAILAVGGSAWTRRGLAPRLGERWTGLPGMADSGPVTLPPVVPAAGLPRGRGLETVRQPLEAALSALLYASYASALMTGGRAPRPKDAGAASWASATLVGSLLLVMAGAVIRLEGIAGAPLPMLEVARRSGQGTARLYAWVLGVAATNSATATAASLGNRLARLLGGPGPARLFVVLSAWVASLAGLGALVGKAYPLLGWAWLPVTLGLVGCPPRACPPKTQVL